MPRRSHVQVAPELVRVARQLPRRMEQRVYNGAARAGAQVIRREAIDNLGDGDRKDVIAQKQRRSRIGAKVSYAIGVSSERWQLVFREFGRQAIEAPAGSAIPMRLEDGEIVFTKHVDAVAPDPFFRPAWDGKGKAAIEEMGRVWFRGLERESKRLVGSFGKSGLRSRGRRR